MLLSEIFTGANGTYMAVLPTQATQKLLDDWAALHNLVLDDNLHVTVLYSRVVIYPVTNQDSHICIPLGYEKFGKSLVVLLDAQSIVDRHNSLIKMGATHDFNPFTPHMTLFTDTNIDISELPDIPFSLAFEREYKEDLKLD